MLKKLPKKLNKFFNRFYLEMLVKLETKSARVKGIEFRWHKKENVK